MTTAINRRNHGSGGAFVLGKGQKKADGEIASLLWPRHELSLVSACFLLLTISYSSLLFPSVPSDGDLLRGGHTTLSSSSSGLLFSPFHRAFLFLFHNLL